jgi:tellurite methyltransferase
VRRAIDGFHEDDEGDWVAELACLHNQHVRHRPPFHERPWTTTAEGRASRIGAELDCPLCDRCELPEGLRMARSLEFDEQTLPPGLRRDHRVAARTWAVLRVHAGSARFTMAVDPPIDRRMRADDRQAIPPGVLHAVEPEGAVVLTVDFFAGSR